MTTVQAIQYTQRTAEWHRLARDLGLRAASTPGPEWAEFDGDGILAIHDAGGDAARAGNTELHVLVDDLDAVEAALRTTGATVSRHALAGVGDVATAKASSGVRVSASAGARSARGDLAVQPLWYQEDGAEAVRILAALGLRQRLRSDSGTWVETAADGGGSAAFHARERAAIELSLEYAGDLDALAERLRIAGHTATIVDEAYNRTLLVPTPDGWTLWVNGPITDLYGYSRVE